MRASSGPLANSASLDQIATLTEDVPAPEMVFDANKVELHFNRTGLTFRFDVVGGLLGCTLRAQKKGAAKTTGAAADSSEDTETTKKAEALPFYSVIRPPKQVEHQLAKTWTERSKRLALSACVLIAVLWSLL